MRLADTLLSEVKLLGAYGTLHIGASEFLFDIENLPLIESRVWYEDKD